MREILSKEPWWARPPSPGQDESELEWGWLVHYSEGEPRFEFVHERPTEEQIRNRKSCRITPPQSDHPPMWEQACSHTGFVACP